LDLLGKSVIILVMRKAGCDILVGTSGWHYAHWEGPFYPKGLSKSKWFEHYAKHFDTVEINNTFYHLPKEHTFEKWRKQAPKNFIYTVKANRFITHIKRLKYASESLERFFKGVDLLEGRLGPVLYQLPPSFHKDLEILGDFLQFLPKKKIAVFEFRHKSWFSDDTYQLLNKFGAGFCIHDLVGNETPRVITGGLIYIRFHGPSGRYAGNYTKSALQDWAKWIEDNMKEARSVYAYFNNDVGGHAINNAKQLIEQIRDL